MPKALHSGHAPLLDMPPPSAAPARPARVHVLRRKMPEVPRKPRWHDHLREGLEPLLFALTVVLAMVALGFWMSPPSAQRGSDLQAAPTAHPAPAPAQAG